MASIHPNIPGLLPVIGMGSCPSRWEGAAPDIQPPLFPSSTHAGSHVSGWWPPHGPACPAWWAGGSPRALLPALPEPWPGHRWGYLDTPTCQVGLGSGDPLRQGGLGEGKGVTAGHCQRGTRDPLLHSCPIPPHTSAGPGESPHTTISGAGTLTPGVGAGPQTLTPGLVFILTHGSRAWGQNGNVPGKSATPVPSSQDVPGDVGEPG